PGEPLPADTPVCGARAGWGVYVPGAVIQNDAGNVEGWLMLGRTGMVLGNAGTATGAYANAYRLDPKNRDAALGYA
ncbi:tetratricopeptide repeat protein, partial [Salmonella enterica]|uniref:tetratricopeptide repeat protein n=1 Tax=Salmonella enterica TaxID=28901 RepID=UPI003D7B33C1